MLKTAVLRIVAATLILGGVMRLVANRAVFEAFGIGALWPEVPYSVYIYRVLGAFVLLSGILLMTIAQKLEKYRLLLKMYALGFAVIGLVMLIAGLTVGLPYRYYLPDPVYCFILAFVLWRAGC
jgi:hypothetical protein